MPASVAALFFSLFSFYGPVNQILVRANLIPEAIDFIRSESTMRGLVVFIQWWTWFGQTIIILMAGMTSIPTTLYEAALVDGANSVQMFRYITLPLLKSVMVYIFRYLPGWRYANVRYPIFIDGWSRFSKFLNFNQ